jgi:hypothetical protein
MGTYTQRARAEVSAPGALFAASPPAGQAAGEERRIEYPQSAKEREAHVHRRAGRGGDDPLLQIAGAGARPDEQPLDHAEEGVGPPRVEREVVVGGQERLPDEVVGAGVIPLHVREHVFPGRVDDEVPVEARGERQQGDDDHPGFAAEEPGGASQHLGYE